MSRRGSSRIYVGNLSSRVRDSDLERMFDRYGRVNRVDLKNGFAFIEFDDSRDADDAVRELDNTDLEGRRIVVETARGSTARPRAAGGKGAYRLRIEGLDSRTSWQDLKDFARKAGSSVVFADVFMDRGRKCGVVEYNDKADFKAALRDLDGEKIDGKRVKISEDRERDRSRSRSRSPRRSRSRSRSKGRSRSRSRSPRRDRDRDAPAPADAAAAPADAPHDDAPVSTENGTH